MPRTTALAAPAVELREATKVFGRVTALNRVSLRVQPGEAVAVLGPNGAGKTTAISLMLGLRKPTSGAAALFGRDPRDPTSCRRIGAMLQDSGLPPTLKVREVLELFRRLYPNPMTVRAALDASDLTEQANVRTASLSGGQKQRLYFALAIVGNPDVLFLDEPSVGLDVESRRRLWRIIGSLKADGKALVLTTHYLEEADALADRIVVVDRGQVIAEGTPSAIKARVGGKTIRFRASGLDEEYLKDLPSVARATVTANLVELYSTRPEDTLARVFRDNVPIADLEVVGAGLEEAFVSITRQNQEALVQ